MRRNLALGLVVLVLTSCQLPSERLPLKQLPEDGPPLPYAEMLTRARLQAATATEAFYVNKWPDLEDAARGLEQSARFLPKASDVPAKHKDTLAIVSGDLGKEAVKLRRAAEAKDVKEANDILQRIHLKVRELRLEE